MMFRAAGAPLDVKYSKGGGAQGQTVSAIP